ncbi:hypothetical protein WJT86_06365 [Microvirga sp. W0021]|uniref:DUF4148 domain-containing protein n=1 Tax=Hohaiivirga grylli TaxID=3133970 RepID=A0ABV0BI78_9HYPH
MVRRSALLMACVIGAFAVAGCSHDVNPVRDTFASMGAAAKVPPAPDFVVASRSYEQGDYIPVGIRQPPRKYPARTPEQIKAVEGQLDAARNRTDAQGRAVLRESAAPSN